ncbi:MAG: T9SS type A sorting domain-containing protein [Candidatus Aegiribacteria sp.]|nr:T9SS type A sorting domain-containing protein [Candidatus Aegiribacteria sp.]
MTGLAAKDNYRIYVSSRNQNRTYRYTAPSITSRYSYIYYTGGSQTRDIAITTEGNIWVATDWTSIPLRLYNTSNTMIDFIDNTLIPSACGVTIDDDGYLWVSDTDNDCIYKIDLTEGIESSVEGTALELQASSNPFAGQVTITATGFDNQATISIYDIRGSLVTGDSFSGSYVFGESDDLSQGVYFVRVRNGNGSEAILELLSL